MFTSLEKLQKNKKIYFASDFHLGAPDASQSKEREKKIVRWLDSIKMDAQCIFLLGDIFDFWFEYKHTIPKGFIRLQAKLLELTDKEIPVIFFTGNHDMWMFGYFPMEFNIPIFREPQVFESNDKKFMVGHGDGLGPGDRVYKLQKKVFKNPLAQSLFRWIHPNIGMGIAQRWSRKSRINNSKQEEALQHDKEWLYAYCQQIEKNQHHDFYIFGHRHLPLDLEIASNSRYINLGEWVNYDTYAVFDGNNVELLKFEG
jgi:UDP-2,3-diacylglucosamine hydrolase